MLDGELPRLNSQATDMALVALFIAFARIGVLTFVLLALPSSPCTHRGRNRVKRSRHVHSNIRARISTFSSHLVTSLSLRAMQDWRIPERGAERCIDTTGRLGPAPLAPGQLSACISARILGCCSAWC